jgi:hypothetical protein
MIVLVESGSWVRVLLDIHTLHTLPPPTTYVAYVACLIPVQGQAQ